jgi:hypothetical protein
MPNISFLDKWDDASSGPLTEDAVGKTHFPPDEHRVSRDSYLPGEVIRGIRTKAVLLYIASGECRIECQEEHAHLIAGDVVRLQGGIYTVTVLGSGELSIINVWKLPSP